MIWLLLLFGWSDPDTVWAEQQYQSHIRFLASDALAGRDTTFLGQKTAAQYIAAHFRRHDIPPAFPQETEGYFQTYQLSVTETVLSSLSLNLKGRGPAASLVHGRDYAFLTPRLGDFSDKAPMVFVGYGIENEDYNDYVNQEIEGHWVVMLDGTPQSDGPIFGKEKVKGGRLWQKLMKAMNRGAKGIVVLLDEPFEGDDNSGPQSSMEFPGEDDGMSTCYPIIKIPSNKRDMFLGKYAAKAARAQKFIDKNEKPQGFTLKGRILDFSVKFENNVKTAENVIGVLPGDDPILKDEYVVISAHYDHVGKKGNVVYNGADDNASGTATIMLLGERLRKISHRRSLILLLVSGEEHGLLGSEYFLKDPIVPYESIVANINFDMVGRPNDGLGIIPAKNDDVTSLNELLKSINTTKNYHLTLLEDLDRFHSRSDHYNFVEKGIPALFFFSGMHDDYHEPTDDWDKIQYEKLASIYFLFEDFTRSVLDGDERPYWLRDREKELSETTTGEKTKPGL